MSAIGKERMATAPVGKSPVNKNRMARPAALEVAVARAETEPPRIWRLTAIIAVCFSLGVAWPIAGGLDFVQRPPGSNPRPLDGEVPPSEDPSAPAPASPPEVPAARMAPLSSARELVRIESQKVQSCHGDAGEMVARCDTPNLDGVIDAPIARLAECPAADGVSGVLSLGLHLDFSRGHVTRVTAGQGTTLPQETSGQLLACAEEAVVGTVLDDIEHEHGRYWVYYRVRFLPPGSPLEPASATDGAPRRTSSADEPLDAAKPRATVDAAKMVSASGQATIGWTTAIVRDSASPLGKVTTRLSHGTRVNVTARMGDWYRIEHLGKSLGWVHRQALGL